MAAMAPSDDGRDGPPPPALPPGDAVVAARGGDVLTAATLLKSDHFPGCQNSRLTPLLPGAPNFRQVPGLPVYGLAIPTAAGARAALDALGAGGGGGRRVLWHNLREEPVVYVNGAPYVVREAAAPFANLEYTGVGGGVWRGAGRGRGTRGRPCGAAPTLRPPPLRATA